MFITLEGIDRSGKSTQAALLAGSLGAESLLLREPGGTAAGDRIRALTKDPELTLDPRAELFLFSAARAELIAEVIDPARTDGVDIVCDRYMDSTVAYQGAGRGLGVEFVERVNELVVGSCVPELTLLLRIDPELAGAREGTGDDRFESEGIEFQRTVAAAYDELARRHERIVVVESDGEVETVATRIRDVVEGRR